MGAWDSNSKTHVATMSKGDFKSNEKSLTLENSSMLAIEFQNEKGETSLLKGDIPVLAGEIIDATLLSKTALLSFLKEQIADAKKKGVSVFNSS